MSDQDAMALSRKMVAPDLFDEAREVLARRLFDYYKALLASKQVPTIPTTRRWL